jgi:hypothetical protein
MRNALTRNRISIAMSTIAFIGLLLMLIINPSTEKFRLTLTPIPYEMNLPSPILKHITAVEQNVYPGVTTVEIYYKPASGDSLWVGSVHYTTVSQYKANARPNEVPLYGAQVKLDKKMSLSAVGAQEAFYDLSSTDRKRTSQFNALIYKPESFIQVR